MKKVMKWNEMNNRVKMGLKGILMTLVLFFYSAPIAFAADAVTGDKAGDWVLGWLKWFVVLGIGYLAIKEFIKGAKVVAFVVIVAGSILYFYMNDPAGFLNGLDFIPKFFIGG